MSHTPGPWVLETPMGTAVPWIVEANKPTYEWRCIAMVSCDDKEFAVKEHHERRYQVMTGRAQITANRSAGQMYSKRWIHKRSGP